MAGRPTDLTEDVTKQIAALVNGGAPIPLACKAVGLSWNTAKVWMKKGKLAPRQEPYATFYEAMQQAKAKWASAAVLRVTKAGDRDWKAAAWLLERRVKGFARPQQVEVSGPKGGPIQHMSLDELVNVVRTTQEAVE